MPKFRKRPVVVEALQLLWTNWDLRKRLLDAEAETAKLKQQLYEALHAPPYVNCICSGCDTVIPQAWKSGMCQPCAEEDCEHTDGAKAIAAELAKVREERDRWEQTARVAAEAANRHSAQVARLTEALENMIRAVYDGGVSYVEALDRARAALAAAPESRETFKEFAERVLATSAAPSDSGTPRLPRVGDEVEVFSCGLWQAATVDRAYESPEAFSWAFKAGHGGGATSYSNTDYWRWPRGRGTP